MINTSAIAAVTKSSIKPRVGATANHHECRVKKGMENKENNNKLW